MQVITITLLILLTFKEIVGKSQKPDSLRIDAMLPATVTASAEVLLLDGQKVYEFNVETKKLYEPKNLSDYFTTIEFPVGAASFNRRKHNDTHHVFAIIFSKTVSQERMLYYLFFQEQLADEDKILDVTDRLGNKPHDKIQPGDFNKDIQGMAVDLRDVDKDIKLIICDGTGLSKATLPEGQIENANSPVTVNLPSDQTKGCGALTMIKKGEVYYLLMATEENLEMFEMKEAELIYQEQETLNIDRDILGKKNSLVTILVAVFSIGIILVLISFVVFGILVYRRRKAVKVNMKDNTTVSATKSAETVSQKAKK